MGAKWLHFRGIRLTLYLLFAFYQSDIGLSLDRVESTLYGAVQVVDYKRYSSVQIFRFTVPEQAKTVSWGFKAFPDALDCAKKNVSIYLQAGSYPLVTPDGESFPQRFFLERTHNQTLTVPCSNESMVYTLHYPMPGEWYAAAFTMSQNDRITQKGLSEDCKYFVVPTMNVVVHEMVKTINREQDTITLGFHEKKIVRFYLEESVWDYRVMVLGCGNSNDVFLSNILCNVTVMSRSTALPGLGVNDGETTCTPNQSEECSVRVTSPDAGTWQYLAFSNHDARTVRLQFVLETSACRNGIAAVPHSLSLPNDTYECILLDTLDRYLGYGDYVSKFGLIDYFSVITPQLILRPKVTAVIPVTLDSELDIGGTLKINLTAYALRASISFSPTEGVLCDPSQQVTLNITHHPGKSESLYVPYPEPGMWHLSLVLRCISENVTANTEDCENVTALVEISIRTSACVDKGCENGGECYIYTRGNSRFSSCQCSAGWRGYGCSDGKFAKSEGTQLEEALLLTLSNLFFIPAIVLSVYRQFYPEAVVYFCTMFFSTFYHACDGDRELIYCITDYDILIFSDFFGSVLAFWVTLVAMMRLKEPYNPTLVVIGCIGLIYGVLSDKHSLWLYVAPAISGFTLLLVSWIYRCRKRGEIYPTWRRYLFFLVPGGLFALLGICLYAFVETDQNYKYVHSFWHVSMAVSILFVLPPSPAWKVKSEYSPKKSKLENNNDPDDDRVGVISTVSDQCDCNRGIVNVSMDVII